MSLTDDVVRTRVGAMFIIFIVSLFAASFPSISKRSKTLRIPRIVFFIGKHFGTGVILSTAFVHLLQDAFSSLQNPAVNARWKIGHWTGLIVLGSLISIFLVEYISTSYVDRLHSYASLPSSPDHSYTSSPITSSPTHIPSDIPDSTYDTRPSPIRTTTEFTPLIQESASPIPNNDSQTQLDIPRRTQSLSYGARGPALHRQYSLPHSHSHTHTHVHEHSDSRFFDGHHRHESRERHGEHGRCARIASATPIIYEPVPVLVSMPRGRSASRLALLQDGEGEGNGMVEGEFEESLGKHGRCAHKDTHERHHGHSHGHGHGNVDIDEDLEGCAGPCAEEDEAEARVGKKRQVVGILVLQMGIMLHSLVIGLTLAITSGSEFTSLVTAIIFHQLFEGLSLGIRISSLPASKAEAKSMDRGEDGGRRKHFFSLLKVTLMLLFAITTPIGIIIGLIVFAKGDTDVAQMKFTQGLMCAISAGMLIYAACVEMLAGDFVMDATLWRSPVWKQTLAIASLLAGMAAMAIIGWH